MNLAKLSDKIDIAKNASDWLYDEFVDNGGELYGLKVRERLEELTMHLRGISKMVDEEFEIKRGKEGNV